MKKGYFALALILSLSVGTALAGCNVGDGPKDNVGDGKHVLDATDEMGKGILDDGGEVHPSEPIRIAVGVETENETRIYYGKPEDEGKIERNGTNIGRWNSNRFFRINGPGRADQGENCYTIITLDIDGFADVSKVGIRVNLINIRACTLLSVSTDKENWVDIGYPDEDYNGIRGDYTTHLDSLYSWEADAEISEGVTSDANIYACYYMVGEYAKQGQKLYLRAGYSDQYWQGLAGMDQPTDLIAYVSYYEKLEVLYDYM